LHIGKDLTANNGVENGSVYMKKGVNVIVLSLHPLSLIISNLYLIADQL